MSSFSQGNQPLIERLASLAADPGLRLFAVMDGAFFNDLRADLKDAGLACRPLYRHADNFDVVLGGPWLIDPCAEEPSDLSTITTKLRAILRIAGGKPGLVVWVGNSDLSEETLYQHLRRLNKVLVPVVDRQPGAGVAGDLSAAAANGDETATTSGRDNERLLIFRHADANVMAQVLPSLDAAQVVRLMGPCDQLLFAPADEWGGGIVQVRKSDDPPVAPPGPLRWTADTLHAINERRMVPFERRLAKALRDRHPGRDFGPDEAFLNAIHQHRRFAQDRFGLRADQHFMDYLEIVARHGSQVVEDGYFRQAMSRAGWSMEEKCRRLRRHYLPKAEGVPG